MRLFRKRLRKIFRLPKCLVRHVELPFWASKILLRCGIFAIPMPWGTILYSDIAINSKAIRRHELVHIAQIRKYGVAYWLASYFYWLIKVGYHNNPYEVEARRLSNTNVEDIYIASVCAAILMKHRTYGSYAVTELESYLLNRMGRYRRDVFNLLVKDLYAREY